MKRGKRETQTPPYPGTRKRRGGKEGAQRYQRQSTIKGGVADSNSFFKGGKRDPSNIVFHLIRKKERGKKECNECVVLFENRFTGGTRHRELVREREGEGEPLVKRFLEEERGRGEHS